MKAGTTIRWFFIAGEWKGRKKTTMKTHKERWREEKEGRKWKEVAALFNRIALLNINAITMLYCMWRHKHTRKYECNNMSRSVEKKGKAWINRRIA